MPCLVFVHRLPLPSFFALVHCLAVVPYFALPRMLRLPCLGVRVGFSVIRVSVTVREYLFVLFGRHAIILLRFGYDCLYRLIIVTHHNVDRSRPIIQFRVIVLVLV